MALITVQGRFSTSPAVQTSKSNRTLVAASLAENSKKNATTGLRDVTWYDVTAWSPEAIGQMSAVSPKDYVRVIGYPSAKAFLRKNGENAASIAINVLSIEVLLDTRPTAAAAAAAPASEVADDEVEF